MSIPSEEVQPAREPSSAGALLALERKRQGIEVVDICDRLYISPLQVQALEDDDYAKLPGATFIRGIIRNYAKLLQIDPQPALDAYAQVKTADAGSAIAVPTHNIRFTPTEGEPRLMRFALLTLALIVIVGGGWLWYSKPDLALVGFVTGGGAKPEPADQAAVPSAAPTGAETAAGPAAASAPEREPNAPAATPAMPPAESAPEKSAPAAAAVAQSDAATGKLLFNFEQASWADVRDRNGKVLLSQFNSKGSEKEVAGQAPFKVTIGNAAGVRLSYNGQPVNLAKGTKVNVARLTVE
jgi:cytoskeleton protein RodZ